MSKILSFPLDDLKFIHQSTENDLKHRYSIIYKDQNGQNFFGIDYDKIVDEPKEKIKFKNKYRPFGLFLTISTSRRVEIELFKGGNTFDMKDIPDLRDLNPGESIYFDITPKGIVFSREINDKEVNKMYLSGLIDFGRLIQLFDNVFDRNDLKDRNNITFIAGGKATLDNNYKILTHNTHSKKILASMEQILTGEGQIEGTEKLNSRFTKDTQKLLNLIKEKDDNIWTKPFTVSNNQNGLITVTSS